MNVLKYKLILLIIFTLPFVISCEEILDSISDPENNPEFIVNTPDDTPDANLTDSRCEDANGNCSFRAAIQQVNANPKFSYLIQLGSETYVLDSPLVIKNGLLIDIEGTGMNSTIIKASDQQSYFSTIYIQTENNVAVINIKDLTITGGSAFSVGFINHPPSGGGIFMEGSRLGVTLANVNLKKNITSFYGGGIANFDGKLTIKSCIIEENECDWGSGGGIYNQDWLSIENTAIVKNTSGSEQGYNISGAGIHNTATGKVSITNSTISSNIFQGSGFEGVGIYNSGKLSLRSSTVSHHNSLSGVFNEGDSLTFLNTAFFDGDFEGTNFYSLGGNFIDILPSGIVINGNPSWPDIRPANGSTDFIFPDLGDLTYINDTWVHIPNENSPLIDKAAGVVPGIDHPDACMDIDQRGKTRSGLCDIGAVEAN